MHFHTYCEAIPERFGAVPLHYCGHNSLTERDSKVRAFNLVMHTLEKPENPTAWTRHVKVGSLWVSADVRQLRFLFYTLEGSQDDELQDSLAVRVLLPAAQYP